MYTPKALYTTERYRERYGLLGTTRQWVSPPSKGGVIGALVTGTLSSDLPSWRVYPDCKKHGKSFVQMRAPGEFNGA